MNAREKLNATVVGGCLAVAALLGLILESWVAFWLTLLVAIAACHQAGGLRPRPEARHPKSGSKGGNGPPDSERMKKVRESP